MNLSPSPKQQFFGNNGRPLDGGLLFTYAAGTNNKIATYQDEVGTPNTNPIVLDFRGEANIWLDPELTYKYVLSPKDDTDPPTNPIWTVDNISVFGLTQQVIGMLLYPRTAAEIAANVVPINYWYPPGNVKRYGATGGGLVDDWQAIQDAVDSCDSFVFFPTGSYKVSRPVLIRPTSFQNLAFVGESRTSTQLMPLTTDVSHTPQNVNTLIFNQSDNGKFSVYNLRFQSDVPYTGISIYAVEGGGGDGSGQAIFSGEISNCWFGMSSQNTGVFRGAFSNYRITGNVFEFTKGCFYRQGVGMGDVIFDDNQCFNCFDAFYDGTTDTIGDNLVSISNLHVYVHNRGNVINTQNSVCMSTSNVQLQASIGAENLGGLGLFSFKDCVNMLCNDFNAYVNAGFGTGPIATAITVNGSSCKFSGGILDGVDVGVKTTGTASQTVTFDSVDIINTQTAAWQNVTGTTSGRMTINGCNWSDSQNNIIVFTTPSQLEVYVNDSRMLNAGLGGSAGARNIAINSNSTVRFADCLIGQNTVSAAAAYYFDLNGAGTVTLVDCKLVGTPPTGINNGAQAIIYDGISGNWTPSVGGTATYVLQDGYYSCKSGMVHITGRLAINAIGTGSQTLISGLPFTSNATYYGAGTIPFFASSATAVTTLGFTVGPGTTVMTLRSLSAAAAGTSNNVIMQNSTDLIFSGQYPLP